MLQIEYAWSLDIAVQTYFEIIKKKTASLIASCCALGAAASNGSKDQIEFFRKLGEKVGIAFQLKDDLLDAFGDADAFGKQVGGDIMANKKTYLYLKALSLAGWNSAHPS